MAANLSQDPALRRRLSEDTALFQGKTSNGHETLLNYYYYYYLHYCYHHY